MSLTVEDGSAVSGAESYATVAAATAYFAKRPHYTLTATWDGDTDVNREGALREASEYLDATFGRFYRGVRQGYIQGLYWPRSMALDDAGYPLPSLPDEIVKATIELAGRALSARLAPDLARDGQVKSKSVDGAVSITFFDHAPNSTTYGAVNNMLVAVLNGKQPGTRVATWDWR